MVFDSEKEFHEALVEVLRNKTGVLYSEDELECGVAAGIEIKREEGEDVDCGHPPFDEADLAERLALFELGRSDVALFGKKHRGDARKMWERLRNFKSMSMSEMESLEPEARRLREGFALGVGGKIHGGYIHDFFDGMGWIEGADVSIPPVWLPYPMSEVAFGDSVEVTVGSLQVKQRYGLRLCVVDYLPVRVSTSEERLVLDAVLRQIDSLAHRFWLHRASALTFFLSGTPVHGDVLCILIDKRSGAMDLLTRAPVPVDAVRSAYSLGHAWWRDLRTGVAHPKPARVRASSRRLFAVEAFVESQPLLKWRDRWVEWNVTHPEWEYKTMGSFRSAYNKAKPPC